MCEESFECDCGTIEVGEREGEGYGVFWTDVGFLEFGDCDVCVFGGEYATDDDFG